MGDRIGWVIPEIYDGISIWVIDGELCNRWEPEDGPRYERTQNLIDFHKRANELVAGTT